MTSLEKQPVIENRMIRLALLLWLGSLFLPAVSLKYTQNVLYGYECFVLASILAIAGPFFGNRTDITPLICLGSLFLHIIFFSLTILDLSKWQIKKHTQRTLSLTLIFLSIVVLILSLLKFGGIYLGHIVWITAFLCAGIAGLGNEKTGP